jgi:hypothetical protein
VAGAVPHGGFSLCYNASNPTALDPPPGFSFSACCLLLCRALPWLSAYYGDNLALHVRRGHKGFQGVDRTCTIHTRRAGHGWLLEPYHCMAKGSLISLPPHEVEADVLLQLLLPWRFFRLWALADGIDPPENMVRCMANNYSPLGFWRSWHRSYNLWLTRYAESPPYLVAVPCTDQIHFYQLHICSTWWSKQYHIRDGNCIHLRGFMARSLFQIACLGVVGQPVHLTGVGPTEVLGRETGNEFLPEQFRCIDMFLRTVRHEGLVSPFMRHRRRGQYLDDDGRQLGRFRRRRRQHVLYVQGAVCEHRGYVRKPSLGRWFTIICTRH